MTLRALSLFSGVGLHDLGLQRAGIEIAGQVEIDPWCDAVLAKHWPNVPRWKDVRDVTRQSVFDRCGRIDLVTGGFPCPDISSAGRGMGILRGSRSSLWLEMLRIIQEIRPRWVLAENVPDLRVRGIDSVLSGLEEAGYSARPMVVGAWAASLKTKRNRVWIVANANGEGCGEFRHTMRRNEPHAPWGAGVSGLGGEQDPGEPPRLFVSKGAAAGGIAGDATRGDRDESGVSGSANGGTGRLDRFIRISRRRALGNANPPRVPEIIGRWILSQEPEATA